jgi:hypothetical protein
MGRYRSKKSIFSLHESYSQGFYCFRIIFSVVMLEVISRSEILIFLLRVDRYMLRIYISTTS